MLLKGSCHCRAITFLVKSDSFYPFCKCYCSICRKTQGGGGFAINLGADKKSLKVKGKKFLSVYRPLVKNPEDKKTSRSSGERNFCRICGSGLWLYDPEWPELIHPFASAIDSELPRAPESTHLMLEFKPTWVETHAAKKDKKFQRYPKESLKEWHERVIKK